MLDSFLRRKPPASPRARWTKGFTLLEILIVLGLVGMLTAFSLPQFSLVQDRLTFNLNRDTFERELGGLSYTAFKEGRPLILSGKYPRNPADAAATPDIYEEPVFEQPLFLEPGQLKPAQPVDAVEATLSLPEDWQVSVTEPIVFQPSGFCGGGSVILLIGEVRYDYDLKSPTCAAVLKE